MYGQNTCICFTLGGSTEPPLDLPQITNNSTVIRCCIVIYWNYAATYFATKSSQEYFAAFYTLCDILMELM